MPRQRRSFECPHCGARVRAGALACAECGADAETGWAEGSDVAGVDVPTGYAEEEDFDYDAFLAREKLDGAGPFARRRLAAIGRRVLVALLALAFLAWLIRR